MEDGPSRAGVCWLPATSTALPVPAADQESAGHLGAGEGGSGRRCVNLLAPMRMEILVAKRLVLLTVSGMALIAVAGVWFSTGRPESADLTAQILKTGTPRSVRTTGPEEWASLMFDSITSEEEAIERAIHYYGSAGNARNGVARLMRAKTANTWLRATYTMASAAGYLEDPELWSLTNGSAPERADMPVWLVGLQVDPVSQRSFIFKSVVPRETANGTIGGSGAGGSLANESDPSPIHTEVAYVLVAGTGYIDGLDAIGLDSQDNPDHRSLQSLAQLPSEELGIVVPTTGIVTSPGVPGEGK